MAKLYIGQSTSNGPSACQGLSRKRRKLVGLFNPSNYCFANVCVQICFHIEPFRNYFRTAVFKKHISPKREPNITKMLVDVFEKLSDDQNEVVNLVKLLKVMGSDYFTVGYIHHDSFEFLLSVYDKLDEELNHMPNHQLLYYIPSENPLKATVEKNWNSFCENKASIIKHLFYGTECSVFTCANCGHNSYASEPSIMFSVALPQKVVQVYFFRKNSALPIQCVELAVKSDDGYCITVETVVCQLSLQYRIQINQIILCHLSKDIRKLHELDWSNKIIPNLKLVAFETSSRLDQFSLTVKVESSSIEPVLSYCAHCFIKSSELKKCSLCRKVSYCNRFCQTNDWAAGHKFSCSLLKESDFLDIGIPILVPLTADVDALDWKFFADGCLNAAQTFLTFSKANSSNDESVNLQNGFHESEENMLSENFHDVECSSDEASASSCSSLEDRQKKLESFWLQIDDFDNHGNFICASDVRSVKCSVHSSKTEESIKIPPALEFDIIATFDANSFEDDERAKLEHLFKDSSNLLEISLRGLDAESWRDFIALIKCSTELPSLTIVFRPKKDETELSESSFISETSKLGYNCPNWAIAKTIHQSSGSVSAADCRKATLEQCLNSHFSPIRVSDRSCDNCEEKCDSIKYSYCWSLPNYLFIHFKRAAEFQNITKLSTAVEFPFDELDLSSFAAIGQPDSQSYSAIYRYRLFAVVQHHGRLQVKGHYTCYIRLPSYEEENNEVSDEESSNSEGNNSNNRSYDWYHFDDENIMKVAESSVARAEPYVLVYENVSLHAKSSVSQIFKS